MSNYLLKGTILHGSQYNYIIQESLGQGSFGIAYLAKVKLQGAIGSLDSNVKVAIKEFYMRDVNGRNGTQVTCPSDRTLFQEYKKNFKREALHLSDLKHDNIVKVLEYFEENGTGYFSMEYIKGTSLDKYIEVNHSLSQKESLDCIEKVSHALKAMHDARMLHLDLKPQNIMRKDDGQIILIDFGLSKHFSEEGEPESSTTIGMGTMGYAPLEHASYKPGAGFPATLDIYALGATLYKCLTGKTPPPASTILNDGFPDDVFKERNISNEIVSFVENAMNPMRKQRIQTMDEFIQKLSVVKNFAKETTSTNYFHDEGTTVEPTIPLNGEDLVNGISYETYFLNDEQKEAIRTYISSMKLVDGVYLPNPYLAGTLRLKYDCMETDGKMYNQFTRAIRFLGSLLSGTNLHWRLPTVKELLKMHEEWSGVPATQHYELCYNPTEVKFDIYQLYKGLQYSTTDLPKLSEPYYVYRITPVIDTRDANIRPVINGYAIMKKESTSIFLSDIYSNWHYGFLSICKDGKWGVINLHGEFVIPMEYDNPIDIEFVTYPHPGPYLPPVLGAIAEANGFRTVYKIQPNYTMKKVINMSLSEWKRAETYT